MIRVLGIDVGVCSGLALLSIDGRKVTWLDGCSTREHPLDCELFAQPFDVLGVEEIAGYSHGDRAHAKSAHLIAASNLAGELVGWARARGVRCFSRPATEWRKQVIGRATPDDAAVKRAVALLVKGLPARTSNHVRDAAVAAMGAAQALRIQGMTRRSA